MNHHEPGKWLAAAQAAILLAMMAGALFVGFDWKSHRAPRTISAPGIFHRSAAAPVPAPTTPPIKEEIADAAESVKEITESLKQKQEAEKREEEAAEAARQKREEKEKEEKKRKREDEEKKKREEEEKRLADDKRKKEEAEKIAADEEAARQKREEEEAAEVPPKEEESTPPVTEDLDAAFAEIDANAIRDAELAQFAQTIDDRISDEFVCLENVPGDIKLRVSMRFFGNGNLNGYPAVISDDDENERYPELEQAAITAVIKAIDRHGPFPMPENPDAFNILVSDEIILNLTHEKEGKPCE